MSRALDHLEQINNNRHDNTGSYLIQPELIEQERKTYQELQVLLEVSFAKAAKDQGIDVYTKHVTLQMNINSLLLDGTWFLTINKMFERYQRATI